MSRMWGMLGSHPPIDRMTGACENITLPQTSFASSNYTEWKRMRKWRRLMMDCEEI